MDHLFDQELMGISFPALYQMAAWHDKQATILRARANRLQLDVERENHVDRRLRFLEQLPATVAKYLRQGRALSMAINMAAEHSAVPYATVKARWDDFINNKDGKSKASRNRLIMDLAELGLKNAQIGERVGLHANSASRIISQERRRRLCFDRAAHPLVAHLDTSRRAEKKDRASRPVQLPLR